MTLQNLDKTEKTEQNLLDLKLVKFSFSFWKIIAVPGVVLIFLARIAPVNWISEGSIARIVFLIVASVIMLFIWFTLIVLTYYGGKTIEGISGSLKDWMEKIGRAKQHKSNVFIVYLMFAIATMGIIVNIAHYF